MTTEVPALITEARAWASKAVLVGRNVFRDLDRGVAYARRLADALEATLRDMHARELHHFETEQAITEAIAMCDKALAVKVDGSREADAAAAGTAAAIRDILAPALSDEHAKTLKRAQAEAWNAAVASMRYEDGTPVEIVAVVNPYIENERRVGG